MSLQNIINQNGNLQAGSQSAVEILAAARTLSAADSGKVFLVRQNANYAITLPDAGDDANVGLKYEFVLTAAGGFDVTMSDGAGHLTGVLVRGDVATAAAAGQTLTFANGAAVDGDSISLIYAGVDQIMARCFSSADAGITIA